MTDSLDVLVNDIERAGDLDLRGARRKQVREAIASWLEVNYPTLEPVEEPPVEFTADDKATLTELSGSGGLAASEGEDHASE